MRGTTSGAEDSVFDMLQIDVLGRGGRNEGLEPRKDAWAGDASLATPSSSRRKPSESSNTSTAQAV